jgi:hypothetical protein
MPENQAPSGAAVLARILWMFLCPMILLILTMTIVTKGDGWLTPADYAFLAILTVMILARVWEFRLGNPQTASGDPATPADLPRYVAGAAILGLAVWAVANYFGNHWLAN